MRSSSHHGERESAARLLLSHLLLQALCIALIGEHLLLLESFLGETDFDFYNRTLIDNTSSWLTLIDKELLPCYHNRLSLFKIAHETAKEVRL